ncbi:Uncharacterized peptidase U32 family member YhbV [hydrothermal vent metagenome]|uniref:Uncharacterized peptidase U32 family member YhbV n=1 Tax=hydrothermal vent metagenome TaxID=652676 RepID=A0A3B1AUK8_9ZZZZ
MQLSLGPISYFWSKDKTLEFYERIAGTPVDIVYLGETICSKRAVMRLSDWMDIGDQLVTAGKEVVLSTMTLLEAESELKMMRRICDNGKFLVEANDIGAMQLMRGRAFVSGPSVNVYNQHTLAKLAELGLCRWVLPVELSSETLADMQDERPEGVETEVFAYGRLPLAYSARCFTARAHNLPKDDCDYKCGEYPDGLVLSAQDKTRFLALNGIQTQSAHTFNVLAELAELNSLGVDILRISPQAEHTDEIIEAFHNCIQGTETPEEASVRLNKKMPIGPCDGYWHGKAGIDDSLLDNYTC